MRTYLCDETPRDPGGGDVTPYGPASYLKRFSAAQASVTSFIVSVMSYTSFGRQQPEERRQSYACGVEPQQADK